MTEEGAICLSKLEKLFQNLYSEDDTEYNLSLNEEDLKPPIVSDWEVKRQNREKSWDQGERRHNSDWSGGNRNNYRGRDRYNYDRRGNFGSRDGYRHNYGYDDRNNRREHNEYDNLPKRRRY